MCLPTGYSSDTSFLGGGGYCDVAPHTFTKLTKIVLSVCAGLVSFQLKFREFVFTSLEGMGGD